MDIDLRTMVQATAGHSTDFDLRHQRHISIAPTITRRGSALSNIWVFDSPKNNQRFTINGDIAFMHCVLFEGDLSIERYWINSSSLNDAKTSSAAPEKSEARVQYKSGCEIQYEFSRFKKNEGQSAGKEIQSGRSGPGSQSNKVDRKMLTELELRSKETLFDNWLLLCAAITRTKNLSIYREANILQSRLDTHRVVALGSLLNDTEVDPGLMLALIGKSLQQGLIYTELEKTMLCMESEITRRST